MSRRIGLALAAACAALGTALLAPPLVLPLLPSQRGLALDAAFTSLFLALVAVSFAALAREPLADRLGLGPGRLSARRSAVLVAGLVGFSQTIDGAIRLAGLDAGSGLAQIDAVVAGARGPALLGLLGGAAVAPGLGEELFARGWILRGVARRFGRAAGILISSAVFGALHGEPVHASAAFGLGLYLGWIAEVTGSIRTSMLAHVTNNVLALLTSAYGMALPPGLPGVALLAGGAAVALLGLAASCAEAPRGQAPHPCPPPAASAEP
ncbi:MAG TPA: type II CAAX endopeptidase family protein [Myxococcota bacterium]|nr:type II CAAX endopeptidase family protein [Myxococcota bacterium]